MQSLTQQLKPIRIDENYAKGKFDGLIGELNKEAWLNEIGYKQGYLDGVGQAIEQKLLLKKINN